MDAFFPSYCSVCYKVLNNSAELYCSQECKLQDSAPRLVRQKSSKMPSLELHYPSLLGECHQNCCSHTHTEVPVSIPDLSLSDEEDYSDEGDGRILAESI